MLGPQVGIVVKTQHNLAYYRDLFEYYKERLEIILSLYNVDTPDFIIIHLKEIIISDHLKIGRLYQIESPKRLINISETKTNLWVDTRPLYIYNLTKSITVYVQKYIIKFANPFCCDFYNLS